MKDDLTLCAEVFLKEQTKLYDEPVAQDIEEAKEFLEDCFAQVFDNIKEVREYLSEEGMDVDEITDEELAEELAKKGYQFSSANSINVGRLVPQVVYYVNAYAKLLENEEIEDGEKINVVVPTGNFGNILAAYYAKQMGVPIDKLVCASNDNKVLFDFFQTGDYDRNREFILTTSPSMDILISSNLERLLYRISGDDDQKTKDMMEALKSTGKYTITEDMKAQKLYFRLL